MTRLRGVLALSVLVLVAALLLFGRVGSSSPTISGVPAGSPPASPARSATRDPETRLRLVELASLPVQAQQTVALIERGGPYPYPRDGVTFANREQRLPDHPRGFYREYTVPTPGENDRGARRIVTGDRDRQFFYTGDHYATFVRIRR